MKELVTHIVKALVDSPDKVEIKEINGDKSIIIEVKVADEDRGKVIGKEGRIIKSIRTIISSAAAKIDKRTSVELIE